MVWAPKHAAAAALTVLAPLTLSGGASGQVRAAVYPPPLLIAPAPVASPPALLRFYPPDLLARHVSGRVVLDCQKDATGAPRDCVVAQTPSAEPAFGEAALRLVQTVEGKAFFPIFNAPSAIFVLFFADPPRISVQDGRPSIITMPDWIAKPSGEQAGDVFPELAARMGVEGHVLMRCGVVRTGDVADCVVKAENPPGLGFGEAALKLAPFFRMRPMTRNGVPVEGGAVNIPITFAIPYPPPPAVAAPTPASQ
jgi:TonB family protein